MLKLEQRRRLNASSGPTPKRTALPTLKGTLFAFLLVCGLPARAADPSLEQMQQFLEVMKGYYGLMTQVHEIAADPDKTFILQMMKAKEFFEQSGQRDKAVALLRDLSDHHRSPVVRNAASVMLADELNDSGNKNEAAAVMERALRAGMK